ncbi:Putative ribonuclease H domain-containing protein [Colletotrichum destructivum]|uniref:Ribonuclease H domain-containing protein n=1 Tax=Colletotrichum destructivum TaxID=34406 RepID=A0AAX4I983_9PEZI|nr:Putative ribonuclease H domain-containing protein [Colletotrichum destructivum]
MSSTHHNAKIHGLPWQEERKFDPAMNFRPQGTDLRSIELHHHGPWVFLSCGLGDPSRLRPGNGTANAIAAVGVYVGEDSLYNMSLVLDESSPTNQIAELRAGYYGLINALDIQEARVQGTKLTQVVINDDSEYLVKGMTEWVFRWEKNGYRAAKGTTVVNANLFRLLLRWVSRLNDRGVEVLFCHVKRRDNTEAGDCANIALDRIKQGHLS